MIKNKNAIAVENKSLPNLLILFHHINSLKYRHPLRSTQKVDKDKLNLKEGKKIK